MRTIINMLNWHHFGTVTIMSEPLREGHNTSIRFGTVPAIRTVPVIMTGHLQCASKAVRDPSLATTKYQFEMKPGCQSPKWCLQSNQTTIRAVIHHINSTHRSSFSRASCRHRAAGDISVVSPRLFYFVTLFTPPRPRDNSRSQDINSSLLHNGTPT